MRNKVSCLLLAIGVSLFTAGCANKIDATDHETLRDSLTQIKDGMGAEERKRFSRSLNMVVIYASTPNPENISFMLQKGLLNLDDEYIILDSVIQASPSLPMSIKDAIHEKTAEQIIAIAAEKEETMNLREGEVKKSSKASPYSLPGALGDKRNAAGAYGSGLKRIMQEEAARIIGRKG